MGTDFVHLRRFIFKESCWKPWSVQPSQPEVRAVSTAGAMAELRRTGHKPLPVSLRGSAGPSAVWGHSQSEHKAGKRRQIGWEQFSRCSLLAQTPSDADNWLVYCSLLAPWPLWSDMAHYVRFPWFILLTFLLIHVAEARLDWQIQRPKSSLLTWHSMVRRYFPTWAALNYCTDEVMGKKWEDGSVTAAYWAI